jgi:Concanavalin A-like lectin/glucanases superfamily/Kelch motif
MTLCSFDPTGIWKTVNYYCVFNNSTGVWGTGIWYPNYYQKHSMKIFSEQDVGYGLDVIDSKISLSPPEDEYLISSYFIPENTDLYNTKILPDSHGLNDISLSFPDRLITLVLDESGSMTWKDRNKTRHIISDLYVQKVGHTYPGLSLFKIFKFGGENIHLSFSSALSSSNPYATSSSLQDQYLFTDPINKFAGIRIVRREDAFPANPIDGEIVFDGIASNYNDTNLTPAKTYYYTIYTFDINYNFSNGVRVLVQPHTTDSPRGVRTCSHDVRTGSGVIVDEYVDGVWHMDEATGSVCHDFAANIDMTVYDSSTIRLNQSDVPVGTSGIRFDGSSTNISTLLKIPELSLQNNEKMTLMAWIYPFAVSSHSAIVSRANSNADINYVLGYDSANNRLSFRKGSGVGDIVYSDALSIVCNQWNHVACVVALDSKLVNFYVNGHLAGSDVFSDGATSSIPMVYNIGSSEDFDYSTFFGYITEVSVHSIDRDVLYISTEFSAKREDNGDRLLVINYDIPDFYNFTDHDIHIVKNNFNIPSNIDDGTLIYVYDISIPGKYYTTYREDFVLGSTYYFRAFSIDSLGVYSDIRDSMSFSVVIPDMNAEFRNALEDDASTIAAPTGLTLTNGDRKTYIQWEYASVDERIKRLRIYRSLSSFPVIDEDGNSDGDLVYECDPIITSGFVDRELENNQKCYYTLLFVDRYERISDTSTIIGEPATGLDESIVPLLEVEDIGYTIESGTHINLFWNDVIQEKDLVTYFGNDVVFYMQMTDDFGSAVSNTNYTITADVSGSYSYPEGVAEDVFSAVVPEEGSINSPSMASLYNFVVCKEENGISKGIIEITKNTDLLNNIASIQATIRFTITYSGKDGNVFSYQSLPMFVKWINPLSYSITNRDNRYVKITRKAKISVLDDQVPSTEDRRDGVYVSSHHGYVARIYIENSGSAALTLSTVELAGYEANVNWDDATAIPSRGELLSDENIVIPSTVEMQSGTRDILDAFGNATGETEEVSYVDVPITSPNAPKSIFLYTKIFLHGSNFIVKRSLIVFGSPLKVELLPRVPVSDGRQIAEQSVLVYMVDPDDPDNLSSRALVDDGTIVEWHLTKKSNAIDRTFYSTSNYVSTSGGIFSTTENGVARNVFLGPVNNIKTYGYDSNGDPLYETHTLSASVFYNGIASEDIIDIEMVPLMDRGHRVMPSHFLMEFDSLKQQFWSDGIGYATLIISHNANTSVTKYSDAFRECMVSQDKPIYVLGHGQMVRIDTSDPDIEIIWGDVTEQLDNSINRWTLDTTNANIEYGAASINLSENEQTYVYFKLNKKYTEQKPVGFESLKTECSMFGANKETKYVDEIVVTGHITSEFDGNITTLTAGGSVETGVLPTVLVPQEPLKIKVVDRRAKDQEGNIRQSNGIIIDGKTINQFLIEVSLAGALLPDGTGVHSGDAIVPDGTEVDVSVINYDENSVIPIATKLYTRTYADSFIDPLQKHSYVILELESLQPRKTINANITISTSYSYLLGSERTASICLLMRYDATDWLDESSESFLKTIFSTRTDIYNTSTQKWMTASNMSYARGHLCVEVVSDMVYAIGGVGINSIMPVVEEYDIFTDLWEEKTPMLTPRMAAVSASDGSKIYVFGGIEYDSVKDSVFVTTKCEMYDPLLDQWDAIAEMPSIDIGAIDKMSYGVSHGTAVYVASLNRIYIFSGIRSISGDGAFVDCNDRILYYDIVLDSWGYSEPIDYSIFPEYHRLSPKCILDTNEIVVFSGAYQTQDGSLDYLVTSYSYDFITDTVARSDDYFDKMTYPRYLSAGAQDGTNYYMACGFSKKSETLNNFDIISGITSVPYNVTTGVLCPKSRNGSGASVVDYYGNKCFVVAGGLESGKSSLFLDISILPKEDNLYLNGVQNLDAEVIVTNDNGDTEINTQIEVRGYVQKTGLINDTVIEPWYIKNNVLFWQNEFDVTDGEAYLSLFPRSDDIITNIRDSLSYVCNENADRYKIVLQGIVSSGDDPGSQDNSSHEYHGFNSIGVVNDIALTQALDPDCLVYVSSNMILAGLADYTNGDNKFKLVSSPLYSSVCPSIMCSAENMVVPVIEDLTPDGPVSMADTIGILDELNTTMPNGPSPLYDCLSEISVSMSDPLYDGWGKSVLLLADSDPNGSFISIDDCVSEINSIENMYDVPVVSGSLSIFSPSLVSNYRKSSSDIALDKISYKTGGQSIGIQSDDVNRIVCDLTGNLIGSIGYGTAVYVIDMGDEVNIRSLQLYYDIPDNTSGLWRVAISSNPYEYSIYSQYFDPSSTVDFDQMRGRFVKIEITLKSCLSVGNSLRGWADFTIKEWSEFTSYGWSELGLANDAYTPTDAPRVTGLSMTYIKKKKDYLFTNDIIVSSHSQQSVSVVDADNNDNEIKVGVSRSSSHNWSDYNSPAKPARRNAGRFVFLSNGSYGQSSEATSGWSDMTLFGWSSLTISAWTTLTLVVQGESDHIDILRESLHDINGFVFEAAYGPWEYDSTISVYDENNDVIDHEKYRVLPRDGQIIFDTKQYGILYLQIEQPDKIRTAVEIGNDEQRTISLYGIGNMYSIEQSCKDYLQGDPSIPPTTITAVCADSPWLDCPDPFNSMAVVTVDSVAGNHCFDIANGTYVYDSALDTVAFTGWWYVNVETNVVLIIMYCKSNSGWYAEIFNRGTGSAIFGSSLNECICVTLDEDRFKDISDTEFCCDTNTHVPMGIFTLDGVGDCLLFHASVEIMPI